MVVLEGSQMATTTLGGPYTQGAPALKIVQKRFLGLHQWLSPVYSKEIKEQLVSVTNKIYQLRSEI
jgi:pumilio RNA-binding family